MKYSLFVLLAAQFAHAGLIIQSGPGNFANDTNILVDEPGLISTGNPVEGQANNTEFVFLFSSDELLNADGSGQSRVEAEDGGFMVMSLLPKLANVGFKTLIFNLEDVVKNGSVTIQVDQMVGDSLTGTFDIGKNGSNWFRIHAIDDQVITKVSMITTQDVGNIKQVRVGGLGDYNTPEEVPEPGSVVLAGLGLGLLGLARLRR